MDIKYFKKIKLPDKPGVYFFLRSKEILYIGKATSLKDRVKSYFGKDLIETRGPIILDMVFKADKIDWIVTDSVLEALILEANLIKEHQPKYNTKEKSDKSFNYVCITKEKFPKVLVVRGKNVQHRVLNKIYGPYTNGPQLREAMKIIRRILPFLDDKSKNHYKFYKQVDLVPDISNEDGIKQYKKNIQNLKLFFAGKKKKVLKNLEKEMKQYAKNREFEKAGETKRKIFALQHINDVALLKSEGSSIFSPLRPSPSEWDPRGFKNERTFAFRIEAYDIAHMGGKNMVGVMTVVLDGEAEKNEYKKFRIRTQNNANDTGALSEVLERRMAHREWPYPSLIVVDGGVAQINAAKKVMSRSNLDIAIVSVVKDEKHKPKAILGDEKIIAKYKREILLANSEAHRFAIAYHKNLRGRNFLK
ncbi:MAG: GIY-YIG nuclease family protein [Minisyncoccia bacterium]